MEMKIQCTSQGMRRWRNVITVVIHSDWFGNFRHGAHHDMEHMHNQQ